MKYKKEKMKFNSSNSTALITAYAVNPYKGSEDGTAWNILLEIAKYHKVIAITRENNQEPIERYLKENNIPQAVNITFQYFDLPYWMRFWKKGGSGALLYFYMWQRGIISFIKKQDYKFDLVHNLNFHNDWTPSFLWKLEKPFVWGPVGHHPAFPQAYMHESYGAKFKILEKIKWTVKQMFWKFDPSLKKTKAKASKIIAINSGVQKVLSVEEGKICMLPAVASEQIEDGDLIQYEEDVTSSFQVLSIGRFVPMKGFDMTLRAFAKFYHNQSVHLQPYLKLQLIGEGPEKNALMDLAGKLDINHVVKFTDWVERSKLDHHFKKSALFLFPSHEGAGMVVPEALSYGLPILCYDNIGPGEFVDETCGLKAAYTTYEESIDTFATYLDNLYKQPRQLKKLSQGAREQFKNQFTWQRKGEVIHGIYESILNGEKKNTHEEGRMHTPV